MTQTNRNREFTLIELGWTPHFEKSLENWNSFPRPLFPARVLTTYGSNCRIAGTAGHFVAAMRGNLKWQPEGTPVAGDWVVCSGSLFSDAAIEGILARKSQFVRKAAGRNAQQVVASNIDIVFLVMSLTEDYNLRRLDRYLATAWESGATPIVLLNKQDLVPDWKTRQREVTSLTGGLPVLVTSAKQEFGLKELESYLEPGTTVALVGSSGAGKSTLLNCLLGEEVQRTREVRESDGRGQHATTRREMFRLPQGAWVLDTPGMRELHLWEAETGIKTAFQDIQEWSSQCRFTDCTHRQEPGCAVQQALHDGSLDQARFENYAKLQRELAYQERRHNKFAASQQKQRWKRIHRQLKKAYKKHPGKG